MPDTDQGVQRWCPVVPGIALDGHMNGLMYRSSDQPRIQTDLEECLAANQRVCKVLNHGTRMQLTLPIW